MDLITTGAALAAANKLVGKTADAISEDLAKIYAAGRDKIVAVASRKTDVTKQGQVNLRVARGVFWNGSFTDEAICAEYFGGILAASRSDDGKDDMGVFYVDIIKSISSCQLKMHYILYRTLNKELMKDNGKKDLNPGLESELQNLQLFIPLAEIVEQMGNEDIGAILHGLHAKNLLGNFQTDNYALGNESSLPYLKTSPTSLGVQLFAIANNMFPYWREFSKTDFGDFEDVRLPKYYGNSIEKVLEKSGLKKEADPSASAKPQKEI